MILVYLVLFMLPSTFHGEDIFYHFDKINRHISTPIFKRQIIPRANTIIRHYFTLLEKLDSHNINISQFKTLLDRSNQTIKKSLESCEKKQMDICLKNLNDVVGIHYTMDYEINLLLHSILAGRKSKRRAITDKMMVFRAKLSDFSRKNLAFIHSLETTLLTANTPYQNSMKTIQKIHAEQGLLWPSFDQLTTLLIPENITADYEVLYHNFIKNLERHIVEEEKDFYLTANLEKLNNIWNNFHMRMTKSTIKLSKSAENTIETIHQSWNLILKTILNNTRN